MPIHPKQEIQKNMYRQNKAPSLMSFITCIYTFIQTLFKERSVWILCRSNCTVTYLNYIYLTNKSEKIFQYNCGL